MIDPIELHALADKELTSEREEALRKELALSPESQVELEAILTVKRVLSEKTSPVHCRAEWKACVSRLNEMDRTRKVERLVSGRTAWGLAGGLFALILVAGMVNHGPDNANVHSADLARIVTSLGPSRDARNVIESNQQLDSLLAEAKRSIDPNRLTILSSAFGEADGRPVTRLTLRDASGDLALVMVPDVLKLDGLGEVQRDHSFRLGHIGRMNCVAWTDGPYTLMLVAERGYEDLVTTASRITLRGPSR
jgi:hypothetical protein